MAKRSTPNPLSPPAGPPTHLSALAQAQDRFIAAWGQMGSTWGISRTMAEAHALLYITGQPLCTDEVMERLKISRGNASMSLRALLDWGITRRASKRGDRKEYFEAEQDVWALLKAVVRERMKREVQPVLASMFEIRDMLQGDAVPAGDEHNQRLDAMIQLLQLFDQLGERFVDWPTDHLRETAKGLADSTA